MNGGRRIAAANFSMSGIPSPSGPKMQVITTPVTATAIPEKSISPALSRGPVERREV